MTITLTGEAAFEFNTQLARRGEERLALTPLSELWRIPGS